MENPKGQGQGVVADKLNFAITVWNCDMRWLFPQRGLGDNSTAARAGGQSPSLTAAEIKGVQLLGGNLPASTQKEPSLQT